jgi:hypothetical protein
VNKFVLLYYGFQEPTPEVAAAWQRWFAGLADHIVDSGNPLGQGVEITKTARRELSPDRGSATGYSIISAASMAEAERLLEGCPFVDSVRLHEAMAM